MVVLSQNLASFNSLEDMIGAVGRHQNLMINGVDIDTPVGRSILHCHLHCQLLQHHIFLGRFYT